MKKYSKLIGITVLIVSVYSIFLFSAERLNESMPKLSLKNYSNGESASHIEDLVIDGSMDIQEYGVFEPFRLLDNEVTYKSELSLFDRLDNGLSLKTFYQLEKKHPSFMRGKEEHYTYLDETDDQIGFVYTPFTMWDSFPTTFEVSLIDKDDDEITTIVEDIPNYEAYSYVDVADVYVDEDIVYVTSIHVKNHTSGEDLDQTEELFVHAFDMTEGDLVNTELIETFDQSMTESTSDYVEVIRDEASDDEIYIVQKAVAFNEYGPDTTAIKKAYSYSIKSKELEAYEVSELDDYSGYGPLQLYDGTLYYLTVKEGDGKLVSYNLAKDEEKYYTLPQVNDSSQVAGDTTLDDFVHVKDGKLYIVPTYVNSYDAGSNVYVYDLDSMETIFVGEFVVDNTAADQSPFELNIYEVYFN
ncbi:MAG TPA: hypothetical protein VK125_02525 [Bacillota bacterium]|nr:hypothetical protein [Bacillota bacterium]